VHRSLYPLPAQVQENPPHLRCIASTLPRHPHGFRSWGRKLYPQNKKLETNEHLENFSHTTAALSNRWLSSILLHVRLHLLGSKDCGSLRWAVAAPNGGRCYKHQFGSYKSINIYQPKSKTDAKNSPN
jgi:hypothetical protein